MARIIIKWKIEPDDPGAREDVETGELARFTGELDYVNNLRDAMQVILNPYKNE